MNNLLKPAVRFLYKRKAFSLLNIAGLAVGIAASLLIFLVIRNEVSYDNFHPDGQQIYRLVNTVMNRSNGETTEYNSGAPFPMPVAMRQDFPQLEAVGAAWQLGAAQVYIPNKDITKDEKRFKENEGMFWTEPSLYQIFGFTWLAGAAGELSQPNTVVLAESLAKKYYGSAEGAIGSTLQLWSFRIPFRVVGVFRDMPPNTDLPVVFGASYMTVQMKLAPLVFSDKDAWNYSRDNHQLFVKMRKGQSIAGVQGQLPNFVSKYTTANPKTRRTFTLQPLADMHFNKNFSTYKADTLTKKELWSLGLIGAFLLVVACINFINLSTAQSINRAKEIGVRKVLGSNRSQLIRQFMQETALITLLAVILGTLLAAAGVPFLNQLMHKGLSLGLISNPSIVVYLVVTALLVTLLAGFYPALVLSGFKPATVFKYKVTTKAGGLYLRRSLVVFQFVIAQLLIIGTVVVIKQMHYFRDKPLGFEKDGIVLINLPSDSALKLKYPMLINRTANLPGVAATSLCMEAPSATWSYNEKVFFENETTERGFNITRQLADTGFYRTFGITLLDGRFPFASDSTQELVVNEATVKRLGLTGAGDIIGKSISFDGVKRYPVVGVVRDYNSRSLRDGIEPIAISPQFPAYEWLAVRMNRETMNTTLPAVRSLFTSIYPTYMYDPVFFDQRIEKYYSNEAMTSQLFKLFAIIAILISCLGLYGLVSFMAVQKTKEVGIRKVLGASVQSIVFLFSREFTLLIGIAFVVATPIAYYFMHKWLAGFHYHITLGAGIFILSIVFSLFIAWMTVGFKALRAALVNPVKSLKTE